MHSLKERQDINEIKGANTPRHPTSITSGQENKTKSTAVKSRHTYYMIPIHSIPDRACRGKSFRVRSKSRSTWWDILKDKIETGRLNETCFQNEIKRLGTSKGLVISLKLNWEWKWGKRLTIRTTKYHIAPRNLNIESPATDQRTTSM